MYIKQENMQDEVCYTTP